MFSSFFESSLPQSFNSLSNSNVTLDVTNSNWKQDLSYLQTGVALCGVNASMMHKSWFWCTSEWDRQSPFFAISRYKKKIKINNSTLFVLVYLYEVFVAFVKRRYWDYLICILNFLSNLTAFSMINTTGTIVFVPLHEIVYLGSIIIDVIFWNAVTAVAQAGDIIWFMNENWTKNLSGFVAFWSI